MARASCKRAAFMAFCLAGPTLAGAAVRFAELEKPPPTRREAFTWRMIRYSPAEIVQRTGRDVHPPFYYLTLWVWALAAPTTVLGLRWFSAAAGTGAVTLAGVCVWEAVRAGKPASSALGNVGALLSAATAGILLAFNWELVLLSRTARMYALGILLCVLATWLLLRAMRGGGRLGPWCVYSLAAAACCYTHYWAALTVAGQLAAVFLAQVSPRGTVSPGQRPRSLRGPAVAATTVAVLYLPWLPSLMHQLLVVHTGFWTGKFGWDDLSYVFSGFATGMNHYWTGWQFANAALVAFVLLFAAFSENEYLRVLSFATAIPIALGVLASLLLGSTMFMPRALAFAQATFLICLAVMLHPRPDSPARSALAALLCANVIVAFVFQWRSEPQSVPGARRLVAVLKRLGYNPGEPIIASKPPVALMIDMLLDGSGAVVHCLRPSSGSVGHQPHAAAIPDDWWIGERELEALDSKVLWVVGGAKLRLSGRYDRLVQAAFYDMSVPRVIVRMEHTEEPSRRRPLRRAPHKGA